MNQFSYICYQEGSFALVSYYTCLRNVTTPAEENTFFSECIRYANVINFDWASVNVTDDMEDEDCAKFRAFTGCKAYHLTQKCGLNATTKNMTTARAAAQFFLASLNSAQRGFFGNKTCLVASPNDLDSAIVAFVNYRPKTTTTTSTTTTETPPIGRVGRVDPDGDQDRTRSISTRRTRQTTTQDYYESAGLSVKPTSLIVSIQLMSFFILYLNFFKQ